MMRLKEICVFCGSNAGDDPAYATAARDLGRHLAKNDIGLVFGGGKVGMMGILADSVLASGGRVTGVIPHFLSRKEVEHEGCTAMIRVDTMHARKAIMFDRSDAFITLPGGTGTLDEFFEILTWSQLGLHGKPIGILNVGGYFSPLISMLDSMRDHKFLSVANRDLTVDDSGVTGLLRKLEDWKHPGQEKWLERSLV